MVAQLAGTETVWEQSRQIEHHPLFGDRQTGRSVAREVERFLVHPNVIKSLHTGRALVITKVPDTRVRVVDVLAPASQPSDYLLGRPARAQPREPGTPGAVGGRSVDVRPTNGPRSRTSSQARGLPAARHEGSGPAR
jgi:hypothetical protein